MYASSASAVAGTTSSQQVGITPACGDGLIYKEECDDGDKMDGDGCSSACTKEAGFTCYGHPSICYIACGDGVIAGDEKCDDGGNNDGDGCTASCRLEPGYHCSGAPSNCSKLTYCGDNVTEGNEGCDDGNNTDGDGCSATCTVEQPGQ
jgi:cysteine-rich repeat protein